MIRQKETRMRWHGAALAVVGLALLAPQSMMAAPPAAKAPVTKVRMASHVTIAPGQAKSGHAEAFSLALTDQAGAVSGVNVDLEVYDAHGKKVGQRFWPKQALAPGRKAAYHWSWTPAAPGAYIVRVGVFGATWKPLYYWDNTALALKVL